MEFQGVVLHNVLEAISAIDPSRNSLKTAFLNLLLKHCRLEIHNVNVQVRFPVLNDSYMSMLRLKELNVDSQHLDFGCLLKGIVGSLFVPVKETSHSVSGSSFEILLNTVDQVDRVLLSADLYSSIRLNDLRPVGINLRVPELSVFFTPADISLCLLLGRISIKESQPPKSGKELWKLAARRIDRVISSPRLKFQNLVVTVGLWLQYVNAYVYLLQVVGYSADNDLFKRTATKISQNKRVLKSAKQCWKEISDIEKELPAESVAQARRIARNRAASNVKPVVFKQSYIGTRVKLIGNISHLLGLVWKLIFKLLHFIVCLVTFQWTLAREPMNEDVDILCEHPSPEFCFILSLGRTSVNISPTYDIQISEIEKLESQIGVPFSGFVSVSLSVEAFLIKYVEDICEESLIVSCGKFKVGLPSLTETPLMQEGSKKFLRFAKGRRNNDMESIFWCEPAQSFRLLETSETSTSEKAKVTCDHFLETFLHELWMNWEHTCTKLKKNDILCPENPCLLYETRSYLTYPGPGNLDSGLLKCFFTLGKIHLELGCSTILSASVLLKQIQHALHRTGDTEQTEVRSETLRAMNDPPEARWLGIHKFYGHSWSQALLKMLPKKHIQLGVVIAGARIKLSLEKEFGRGTKDARYMALHNGLYLQFDLENIEVASWPKSTSELASDAEHPGRGEAETECTGLKQPRMIEIPKSETGKYTADWWILLGSHVRISGLRAYFGSSADRIKSQILVLQPVTAHLLSSR